MLKTIPWFLATMLLILITFTMAGCSDDDKKTSSGGGQETEPTTNTTGTGVTTTQSNEEAMQEDMPAPTPADYAGVYEGTLMFDYNLDGTTGTETEEYTIEILEDGTVLLPEGQTTQLNGNSINALLTPSDVFGSVPCDGQLVLHGTIVDDRIDGTVDVAVNCAGIEGEGNGTYTGFKVS